MTLSDLPKSERKSHRVALFEHALEALKGTAENVNDRLESDETVAQHNTQPFVAGLRAQWVEESITSEDVCEFFSDHGYVPITPDDIPLMVHHLQTRTLDCCAMDWACRYVTNVVEARTGTLKYTDDNDLIAAFTTSPLNKLREKLAFEWADFCLKRLLDEDEEEDGSGEVDEESDEDENDEANAEERDSDAPSASSGSEDEEDEEEDDDDALARKHLTKDESSDEDEDASEDEDAEGDAGDAAAELAELEPPCKKAKV